MIRNKIVLFLFAGLLSGIALLAQKAQPPAWSDQEGPIAQQLRGLRQLPDDTRAVTTRQLALRIRALPRTPNKMRLANGLASLATEGDFGHDTLQEVTTTLAAALQEQPVAAKPGEAPRSYLELAKLVRYEHMQASLDDPLFAAAAAKLADDDSSRQNADFTLTDLQGKAWTLKELRGKVVLVNFWATWCSPCRKEMPDLDELQHQFRDKGLVILGITDEPPGTVKPFVDEGHFRFPILLDPQATVNKIFHIDGIPKTFVFDREGKLVAQSIDMRTQRQFREMFRQAGLQ